MPLLKDKIAIVTGASSGIGKAIAEAFAAEGAKTVLVARRKEVLEELAGKLRAKGAEVMVAPADVGDEAQVKALFAKVVGAYGRVDVVVNNAGVAAGKPIDEMTLDYWNDVVRANMTSIFLMGRAAVAQMKAQTPQGGRIINMGSVSAKTPRPDSIAYTATKFAVQGMTHQLTMDGRKYGVVSSVIHPGATFSQFSMRRGRTQPGWGKPGEDYIMASEDVARIAVLMASLPPEVNLYEATILPNEMKSFIGRG
jgi:NADP-dependent 3-hydroxy acid dehydrogenase YdfG